jgi:hypothetical protein
MTIRSERSLTRVLGAMAVASTLSLPHATAFAGEGAPLPTTTDVSAFDSVARELKVGDLVFIRIGFRPFAEVAAATGTWTNHVGVVVDASGDEPRVAESAFPFSRITTLSRFVKRSENGRFAVMRLKEDLTAQQQAGVLAAATRRLGVFYDTGFDLHSRREFCSRFAREVLVEATGHQVGEVETFAHLLAIRSDADQVFWRVWYFGRIPWDRETVTPASLLRSDQVRTVFDGNAKAS